VLGHSLGAYAAAAVAGVLSLPDAMTLVLERGRILDAVPSGAMLAVSLPAERVRGLIGADLSIAAINGPDQCVVAGAEDAIEALRARLAAEDLQAQRLHISSASHSHLVEPMLERYEKQVAGVQLHPPAIPLISDRTGSPVTAAQALDPAFWTVHLRQTVNFSAALDTVLAPSTVLLEVGPGRVLSGLARRHPAFGPGNTAVTSMPHPSDVVPGTEVLLTAAGVLWQAGVELDWAALHSGERRYRTPLPTYPFERTRFRLDGGEPDEAPADPPVERAMSPEARAVAGAFRTILGVAELPDNANFFELGGDSMLALRVVALLRREAGIELDVRTVFRAPTVAALAGVIAGRQPGHPVDAERPGEATRDRPDRWLLCRTRRPQAPLRMYCLPHSGGSSAEFLAWSDRLPDIEVVGVEPPGRGSRLDEQPYGSMAELVTGLVEQVHFRPPYVLFGHSLGAATAYELTVALRERGQPLPERLYLSAHEAPHVPRPVTALAELDDLELLSEVESQFGTLPPEAHTDPEWRSVILRGLRADLRIVQRYRRTQADPVPCPITVLGGAEDLIAEADLLAWRDCTTAAFEHHLIAGGHFYFREHLDDVLAVLAAVRPA
jgi:surfactin synthase thioesterase subunit/acyl carrier protein